MPRRPSKPKDPTFAIIEEMVEKSGLNPTSQSDVTAFTKQFMKAFIERAMKGEMNHFMNEEQAAKVDSEGDESPQNNRNGYTEKTVSTEQGKIKIRQPRDRQARFEPQLVPKHSRRFTGFDNQIVSLYARGMSTRDIQAHLLEMYGTEVSPDLISEVTDEIMLDVQEWQNRPLDPMYPVIFFDAIRIKIRNAANIIIPKAMHIALGVRVDGTRDILGLWLDDTESASFWMSVFNELKARGVEDILIAVTDGLTGLDKAIETAFPNTTHQTCVVHLIRNSLAVVSAKRRKALADRLKTIYHANTLEGAEAALEVFENATGDDAYPSVAKMWRRSWDSIIPFFAFSPKLRRLIYTTNAIESLNRTIRKVLKTKGSFRNDASALKLVWLVIAKNFSSKRGGALWSGVMDELNLMYGERFTKHLI